MANHSTRPAWPWPEEEEGGPKQGAQLAAAPSRFNALTANDDDYDDDDDDEDVVALGGSSARAGDATAACPAALTAAATSPPAVRLMKAIPAVNPPPAPAPEPAMAPKECSPRSCPVSSAKSLRT